ncbi:hypothetical protein GGC63_004137 [Paenibacillus sp. OAS669]|nr:hypothetical protein [Paenibacillus sp. OAS669]
MLRCGLACWKVFSVHIIQQGAERMKRRHLVKNERFYEMLYSYLSKHYSALSKQRSPFR